MDTMLIRVEALDNGADGPALGRALAKHIKDVVGVTAKIDVGAPGTAPRSEGKARRVVDKRPEE